MKKSKAKLIKELCMLARSKVNKLNDSNKRY
jgi:hypothetical protein